MSNQGNSGADEPAPGPWIQKQLQKGLDLLNHGRFAEALQCAQSVLQSQRDLPDAHFLIGLVSLRTNDRSAALHAFRTVTELQPEFAAAWAHYAETLVQSGQYADADAALLRATQNDDGNPMVQQVIGLVLASLNDYQHALGWYEKAARTAPNNVGFLFNLANCQMYVGQLAAAESTLRQLLRIQPGQPNAHWLLSGLVKTGDRRHVDEMQRLIGSGRYQAPGLAYLQYACGKELEDLEAWDEAFDAYAAGAKSRRSTIEYDEKAEIEFFDALERLYTRDWLDDGSVGHHDAAPIFVVGQPRSGTTLVERILGSHSQVHSAGELRQFGDCIARLTGHAGRTPYTRELVESGIEIDPQALGRAYMESTKRFSGNSSNFINKLPFNFLFIPLILKALPNAKIIHLRRGAMDTCFSGFKQLFTDAYPHSYDLGELARHFTRYHKLLGVWRDRFGDRFFEVQYEEITADLESHARELIDYLDLPWEAACLTFAQHTAPVATASSVQVRQGVHTKSVGRWRKYQGSLQALRQVLVDAQIPLD